MSEARHGDVVRFTYTANRYTVLATISGVHLEQINEITGMAEGRLSWELLRKMIADGVVEKEVSDEAANC